MTSPGRSVRIVERYPTRSTGPNTSSAVVECCRVSPSITVLISQPPGGSSSGVTSHGPSGVVRSKVLPCRNCEVRNCQSRALTSFRTV